MTVPLPVKDWTLYSYSLCLACPAYFEMGSPCLRSHKNHSPIKGALTKIFVKKILIAFKSWVNTSCFKNFPSEFIQNGVSKYIYCLASKKIFIDSMLNTNVAIQMKNSLENTFWLFIFRVYVLERRKKTKFTAIVQSIKAQICKTYNKLQKIFFHCICLTYKVIIPW